MRQNVVWIDDHLKYALHHELRHFGFIFGTKQRARVSDAAFSQNRYFRGNSSSHPVFTLRDVAWHLQVYMPRLVLGCVADAFLRADPCLKNQFKNKTQFNAAMQKVPSAYGKALANHHGGSLDIQVRLDLGKELWGIAQTRLKNLVDFFSGFNGTFLAAWTDGKLGAAATEYVPMAKPSFREAVEGIGNSPEFTAKRTEYTGDLRNCVTILTEDFLDYIEYTHAWREIVYTVRTQITRSRLPNQPPLPFQMT
jgi:hypothetical protein